MIQSNLPLRRAYADFQEHVGEAAYENEYFKDGTQSLRHAIKDEGYRKVMHRYGYTYERNEWDQWE